MEDIAIEPARDLTHFISDDSDVCLAKIEKYRTQHPVQHIVLQAWIDEHRILTKSTNPDSCNSKGFDFLQEEDLKGVLKYLPRGTLFNFSSFQRAVRAKQDSEDTYGVNSPKRNRGFDKYETEIQIVGTILIKNGFTTSEAVGLGQYSTDLFEIHKIYEENLDKYFKKRIHGVATTSMRLKKVNFTLSEKEKSESIESQTKEEIVKTIISMAVSSNLDVDEIESIKAEVIKSKPKEFLINIYYELAESQLQEKLGLDND